MATIHDYARMCNAHGERCVTRNCPLSYENNRFEVMCKELVRKHPAEASDIIDKWCAEHPQKTYLQDFLEKFPNACLRPDIPMGCRNNFYGWDSKLCERNCDDCWNKVMPDEADKEEA